MTDPMARPHWQRVVAYDWPALDVPDLEEWTPTQTVTVVIPAYNCQEKVDLTLAALAHQRYPAELLDVVVVDDGSDVALQVPDIAPERTAVLRLDRHLEWGSGRARHAGARAAAGEILLFLDADMIVYPDHVAAHARWHHMAQEAVTLGHKLFVDVEGVTAADVAAAARADRLFELLSEREYQTHEWIERLLEKTKNLTRYRPELFTAAVTATIGMRAELYREAGGFRTHLRSGEDMEFGYRLMAAGAVFIPEPLAKSWHQGEATYMSKALEVRRRNNPNFANYIPLRGRFRPWRRGRSYAVPIVDVIVSAGAETYEEVKRCVDAILASDETDLRVELGIADLTAEMELVHADYADDPRVVITKEAPDTGFPSRYTVFLPPWAGLSTTALSTFTQRLEKDRLGVIHVIVPGVSPDEGTVEIWRTAALHRARRCVAADETVEAVAGRMFGERWMDGSDVGVVDLRRQSLPEGGDAHPGSEQLLEELDAVRKQLSKSQSDHQRLVREQKALRDRRLVRIALRLDARAAPLKTVARRLRRLRRKLRRR